MCNKRKLEKYYNKVSVNGFDEKAKSVYKTFSEAKKTLEEMGDEPGVNILGQISTTADRYLKAISNYDVDKLNMMGPAQRDLAFKEWAQARRINHNSLISKINMGTRYFLQKECGNLAGLPKVTYETRDIAGDFANHLILGEYLTNK